MFQKRKLIHMRNTNLVLRNFKIFRMKKFLNLKVKEKNKKILTSHSKLLRQSIKRNQAHEELARIDKL